MTVHTIATQPFDDQKPGTSGLRKQVSRFMLPHYLENYVQCIFDALPAERHDTLLLGGDGRYFNAEAIQTILRMAAANGYQRVLVGQHGILSTPACSLLIRQYAASGGIVLSASHNPGGPEGDFGLKYNGSNGGPAREAITDAIFAKTKTISEYHIADFPEVDIDAIGCHERLGMSIEVIDPIQDYADLMAELFDFPLIAEKIREGLSITFDGMHAVTGPYAQEIFVNRLGVSPESLCNIVPRTDFGGCHPDPNPTHARALVGLMASEQSSDIAAASDGDGDRHLILGRGSAIVPSDSLAVILANADCAPGYADGMVGAARSMPTSRAIDVVAASQNIPMYETPTGWKFFGSLLDAEKISFCGEESAGAGADHIREKDGLWAILMWLNILAKTGLTVNKLMQQHWQTYGRHYYQRHDYEGIEVAAADQIFAHLMEQLPTLAGQTIADQQIRSAESFSYTDPIDGSESRGQGIIIITDEDDRVVYRRSGTGTVGATVRVYIERYVRESELLEQPVAEMLAPLANLSQTLGNIAEFSGRAHPDVIT